MASAVLFCAASTFINLLLCSLDVVLYDEGAM